MSQNIMEQAALLGNMLKESAEFKAVREREEAMLQDADASKALNQHQQMHTSLQMKQMQGQQLTQEDIQAFKDFESKMMENATVKEFNEAREKFEQLLNQVNTTINNALLADRNACGSGCSCDTGCKCGC